MAGPQDTFEVKQLMLMQNMDATGANLGGMGIASMEMNSEINTSPSIIPGGPGMGA